MLRNLLYSFLTRTGVALINFIILLISARYLGVSTRGEITVLILNIAVVQMVCETFTGYVLVSFIPAFNEKKLLLSGLGFILIIAAAGNFILFVLGQQVKDSAFETFLLSVIVLSHTFFCVIILGRNNVRLYGLLSLLQPFVLVSCLMVVIFYFKVFTLSAYVTALAVSFVTGLLFSGYAVVFMRNSSRDKIESFSFRAILKKGVSLQVSQFCGIFMNRFSYYLLPLPSQVGLYSTACTLSESLLIVANGFVPLILSESFKNRKAAELCLLLLKTAILICLPALVVLQLLPEEIFLSVLGIGFKGIKELMLFYSPVILMQTSLLMLSAFYTGRGQTRQVMICYIAGALMSLLLAPTLVLSWLSAGAALSANIAFGVAFVLMVWIFLKQERFNRKEIFDLRIISAARNLLFK